MKIICKHRRFSIGAALYQKQKKSQKAYKQCSHSSKLMTSNFSHFRIEIVWKLIWEYLMGKQNGMNIFFFLAVYFFYTRCFSLPLTLLSPFRLGPFDCYRHNKLLYWVFRGGHSIEPLFRRSLTYCTFMLKYFYKRCSMFYRVWCVCVCILFAGIVFSFCIYYIFCAAFRLENAWQNRWR